MVAIVGESEGGKPESQQGDKTKTIHGLKPAYSTQEWQDIVVAHFAAPKVDYQSLIANLTKIMNLSLRNTALFSGFLISLLMSSAQAETTLPSTSPNIQYTGRTAIDGDSTRLAFPGSMVEIAFSGPSLTLNGSVDGSASHLNASIDGVDLPRVDLESGQFNYTFKHYLDPAQPHALRLVRRNESWNGVLKIDSITLADEGELLAPPTRPSRSILCIGDSITCGEKSDLIPPETIGLHTWNAERSYGWMLAKDFDAQIHLVSCGGRGLIRDWQGLSEAPTAPVFFERALPDDSTSVWDHQSYQPDLITICLGTNDFSQGIPEKEAFVSAYIKFVARIHELHPEARVLLISGPWFGEGDPKKEALNAYINETVDHFNELGQSFARAHFFTATYPGSELDAHPNALQHRAMATDIGQTIVDWLKW
ncbi:GDSL-like lipase/acylhydrolase domain protein [Verrucomicrobiia bacterium DG1235]|nr:GDSL-like lipase/acylhydrolase domain protein [Verrucomicrobiae bacterium DG1235]